jgi:hypothetical protein
MDNVHDKAEAVIRKRHTAVRAMLFKDEAAWLAYALDALAFVRYCGDVECEGTNDLACHDLHPDDHDEWCWPCRAWMVMQQGDWR